MSKKGSSSKGKKAVSKAIDSDIPVTGTEPVVHSAPKKDRTLLFQKIILFLVAFAVFANSIPNKFNLDDDLYTSNAQKAARHGFKAIPKIFTRHTFSDNENAFEYRPVAMSSFVLQYAYIGQSAHVSHTVNVILYAITCVLIFSLLLKWFKKDHAWYAFAVCLLFAVHPLHTEVVASIKSRDEILALLFVVLSFFASWKYHTSGKWIWLFVYPVIFVVAEMCKRTVAPLFIISPIAFYFFTDMPVKKILLTLIPMFIVFRISTVMISHYLPAEARLFFSMENPFYVSHYSFAERSATAAYVCGWYLYLHLIPYPLVFYYGYKYVPILGWDNIWVWVSTLIFLGGAVYILLNFRKKTIPAFAAIWLLLNIFIFSNLFRPSPGMMAERFMYSASLGFCMLFCWMLFKLFKIDPAGGFKFNAAGKRLAITMCIICIAYGARSVDRNFDWKNKFTLYTHDIQYLGESTKANTLNGELLLALSKLYQNRALFLKNNGDIPGARLAYDTSLNYLDVAKHNFIKAIEITPNLGSAINNLAVIYFNQDSLAQARKYINMALQGTAGLAAGDIALNANDRAKLNHNLGVLYFKDNKVDSALYQFEKAIYYDSTYDQPYIFMSDVFLMSHDTNDAIKVLLKAAKNLPEKGVAYMDLANISLYRNDTATAVVYCEMAAKQHKVNPQIIVFLRNYYQSKNVMDKAQYYDGLLQQRMKERRHTPATEQ